jgi:protein-tyrosine phosphatase
MQTELFWVPTPHPGRLAVAPRPRGGDWLGDEVRGWREAGIDTVLSLLTPDEVREFDLGEEAAACTAHGVQYLTLPVADRGVPKSRAELRQTVEDLVGRLADGRGVAVHCRQGIGRAGLTAAAVLIAAGLTPEEAVARVGAARGRPVPETPDQRRWLDEFARDRVPPAGVAG